MELIKFKNGLLDELFNEKMFNDFLPSTRCCNTPLGDVIETEDAYEIQLMLPAYNKKDFNIEIEGDSIIIEGERKEVEKAKYNHKQSYFGKFRKTYNLPDDIDRDKIDATYKDGVLKIVISKSEEKVVKPKLISVK